MRARKRTPIVFSDEHNEVKIYTVKSRDGFCYQLSFYRAGQRQRKSFADLDEARRAARLQLSQLAGERLGAKTPSAIEMESYTAASRRLEPTGMPLHVCAELFAEAHRLLQGHSILDAARYYMSHYDPSRPRKALPELADEFLESRRATGLSAKYVLTARWTLRHLVDEFGKIPLDDLDAGALDRWMESRSSLTNRSRNTCRVIMVAFGNFLKKRRYLAADRPTVFDGMSVWKDEIVPVTLYTPDEMQSLLSKAGETLLPYLVIGAFAGLRNIEVTRLDWSHIRLERGFIECEASMTKTRRRRLVPITENLRAWLQPIAQSSGHVVPHRDVATALDYFCKKIGTTWKRNALRHSYISYRLALMPDTARVALECGNSPNIIFQHYRELVMPDHAQAWFNILPPADYPQCLIARRNKHGRRNWREIFEQPS